MNSNPSSPENKMNDVILQKLNSSRWKGRVLTGAACGIGLLAIMAGILLAWVNTMRVIPVERVLLQTAQRQVQASAASPEKTESKTALPHGELEWRHVQATSAHGKLLFFLSVSVVLLGAGTLLTLGLVIFNRRATLRQISISLAEISQQMKALQEGRE